MRKNILLVVLQIVIYTYAIGSNLKFKHITEQQGLANNWVRCIYQDEKGFMWFGTSDGVSRYDGYDFKTYRPANINGTTISDVNVNSIIKCNNNQLWFCTDKGAYCYNNKTDNLQPVKNLDIEVILCALNKNDSTIWLGSSSGLYMYNPLQQSLSINKNTLHNQYVNVIFSDSRGKIWVGTRAGLYLYNNVDNSFINIKNNNQPNNKTIYNVLSITEDHKGNIWIGTAQNGLLQLIKNNCNTYSFNFYHIGNILNLLVDSQNMLWFCGDSDQGLGVFNINDSIIDSKKITFYTENLITPGSISDNYISCIFEDNLNDIWIGTLTGGVNYFSRRYKKFNIVNKNSFNHKAIKNNHVNAFYDDQNYIWIGTEAGLEQYDKQKQTFTLYRNIQNNPNSIGGNSVYAIYKDTYKNLWVGAWNGGLSKYNYKTGNFERYLCQNQNDNVFTICQDSNNYLWIGTLGQGLKRLNLKTGSFKTYTNINDNKNSINNNSINHVIFTKKNRLLVSTYSSIDEYDYKNDCFIRYMYNTNPVQDGNKRHIISIFEDSKNNIWVTTNNGFELFDNGFSGKVKYTVNNGLPDNVVQSIIEDNGNFWISTTKGLSKLINGVGQPQNPVFENFYNTDGLPGNEFIKRSSFKTNNGVLFFGTSAGYTYFTPDSITINTIVPNIVLTNFNILNNKNTQTSKYTPILQNINELNHIELPFKNSNFTIKFAAINYLNTEKNKYKYMLKGYDNNWIEADANRIASYTNILPGTYTFLVTGTNNDGIWNPNPKTLSITIIPPWYMTIAFKAAVIIIILLSFYLLYRLRVNSLKRQRKILENKVAQRTNQLLEMNVVLEERQEEIMAQNAELERHRNNLEQLVYERTAELENALKKAEESDKLKSAFLANMSHEIRTPMNAISGFANLLNETNIDTLTRQRYINTINNNAESLLLLINDIIDISILETQQLKLNKTVFNVSQVLDSLYNQFKTKTNSNTVLFYDEVCSQLCLNTDQQRFKQVLFNIIGNAIKYTEKGEIHFGYTVDSNFVKFYVTDTGIGISTDDLKHIFEYFNKVDHKGAKLFRGTGIGLSISKRLIMLMGGEIWVQSVVNKGSEFYFTLPLNK